MQNNQEKVSKGIKGATLIASTISFVWLVAAVIFAVNGEFLSLPLNAQGDFLAGVFAPLAFFWLVVGYFQQGKELRFSRAALLMQAKELRNSVRQQKKLVSTTRAELAILQASSSREIQRELLSKQPDFRFVWRQNCDAPIGKRGHSVGVTNKGFCAHNVRFSVVEEGQKVGRIIQIFDVEQTVIIEIFTDDEKLYNIGFPAVFTIQAHYVDGNGKFVRGLTYATLLDGMLSFAKWEMDQNSPHLWL